MAEAGRPRIELTDEQVALIEKLAGHGLTQAQIADCLPMSERTLSDRIRGGDVDISAAYARGRAKDAETLASRHRDIALGNVDGATVSDQRKALEWRLERQHGFAAKQEIGGMGGGALEVSVTRRVVKTSQNRVAEHVGSMNGNGKS